jgi:RNA polymerase sigma-70 factor, ECF subfamily
LFDSELQLAGDPSAKVTTSLQAEQSVEARQRDIYDSYRHRTFSLAYYMTGNELEAERILADTFVRAFRAAQEPNGQAIDSALLEELRQRSHLGRVIASSIALQPMSTANAPAALGGHNIRRTDLEEALRRLPAPERLLFLLRDVEGYAPATIAALLEIPEEQVQRALLTARIRLRRFLAAAQVERSEAA